MEIEIIRNVFKWLNIAYLPLALSLTCCLWCGVVKTDRVPVVYYVNLLISNLIQSCALITTISLMEKSMDPLDYLIAFIVLGVVYVCCGVASLVFRMHMAVERCFFIACPQFHCIRQTKGFVLLCVGSWAFCVTTVPALLVHEVFLPIIIFVFLAAPVFIICLAATLKSLPAATSASAEEKRRIVGLLVALLLHYALMILPVIIIYVTIIISPPTSLVAGEHVSKLIWTFTILFLLGPFADLILASFMRKGPTDKLLAYLCCCSMDSAAADVSLTSRV